MKNRITNICVIIAVIALNIFFIHRSFDFSKIYPFKRLLIGNTLFYPVCFTSDVRDYGSEVVAINGEPANASNIIGLLSREKNSEKLDVTLKNGGSLQNYSINRQETNKDVLWFFIILVLCADLQFLWGAIVRLVHPHRYLARLFVYFNLSLCFFNFLLIEFLSYRKLTVFFILSSVLLGYIAVSVGFNLTNKMISRSARIILLIPAGCLMGFSIAFPDISQTMVLYEIYLLSIILCALYSLIRITIETIGNRHIYLSRRNFTIVAGIAAGAILPLSIYLLWLYVDLKIPAYLVSCLMLGMPLSIGKRLLENNFFNVRAYHFKGLMIIGINLAVAIICSVFLYYLANTGAANEYKIAYYVAFGAGVSYLLYFKYLLGNKITKTAFRERNYYADSLQNIAELVSSPADLSIKMENIYSEVIRMCGISSLKLMLFGPKPEGFHPRFYNYLEYSPYDSEICNFFKRNNNIILRYTLINNDELETRIYKFMMERNILIVMPLFKGREIKGAAFVGEKSSREFFTDEEINYLRTVSLQLYHLVENDRLFNEYIAKRRFEKELDIASNIQLGLFPKEAPERRGMHICFYNRPFIKVTGDYFDFIKIDRNRTAVIIGDVSGHGLSASMILSMTSSIVNTMLMEKKSIEKAVEEINHFLNFRYNGVDLITLFIGIYNKATRELVYINAGHCAPILIKGGAKRDIAGLEGRSKILGADPSANYFSSRYNFSKSDELILYTDGLIEIFDDNNNDQFNEKSLLDVIYRNKGKDIDGKLKAVMESINRFKGEAIRDDITIIGIKIL